MTIPKMSAQQRQALFYVRQHETKEFGVIVRHASGERLVAKGWAVPALRRRYARESGVCLRLTDAGYFITLQIEGKTI